MQVVAAEPAGHVQCFADNEESRLFFHGKGLRIKLARIHAAVAHFRLVHAFAAADGNGLMLQAVHDVAQGGIAVSMQIAVAVRGSKVVGDGFRQVRAQGVCEVVLRMGAFAGKQVVGGQVGQVVDEDGRVFLPVAGDLQHGGAADAAMSVEQYATIHRADGSEETMAAIGSLKNSELADVPLIDIYDTSTRVPRDLVLVDTPGLSSPDTRHKDALIRFLPEADAILMTVDCNQQITKSLLRFIEESNLAGRKVYLIVTKCDTKPASDRKSIKRYIADNSKLPMEHIVCVSAQQDDLAEFYDLIKQLSQSKREILAAAIYGRLESLKEELKRNVSDLLKQPNSTEELEKELSGHQRQAEDVEQEIKHLISSVKYSVDDVSDGISRSYQDKLFQRLDTLINQGNNNQSDLNAEANTIINSASLQVMAEYRRLITQKLTEQAAKGSPFIQSAVTRLDISGLEVPEQSINIDLGGMGHKYDKAITKVLQFAAIAAIAVPLGMAAVSAASASTVASVGTAGAEAAGAAATGTRLATAVSAVDTVTDVGSIMSTRKLNRTLRMRQLVEKSNLVAKNYTTIDSKVTPKVKGFVESAVSTITDRMAKPRRLRIMHDFIEQQLVPVFAEQIRFFIIWYWSALPPG